MSYSFGLSNFQDKTNYESYFNYSNVKNVTKDIDAIQTVLFNTTKHSLSQRPYVIGRITLKNETEEAESCKSNFEITTEVTVKPELLRVKTSKANPKAEMMYAFELHFDNDFAETRSFKLDLSLTENVENYTQATNISMYTFDKTAQDIIPVKFPV